MYICVELSHFAIQQRARNLPAMQETQVSPLEKRMTTHSTILAWRIPRTEEIGGL